jgi:hypothetical protein
VRPHESNTGEMFEKRIGRTLEPLPARGKLNHDSSLLSDPGFRDTGRCPAERENDFAGRPLNSAVIPVVLAQGAARKEKASDDSDMLLAVLIR